MLPQLRSFAAVIFRRIASKTRKNDRGETVEIFVSLGPGEASAIRQKLLECLTNEPERVVRNKISDAVADVARQYADNSQLPCSFTSPQPPWQRTLSDCPTDDSWPEILGILFNLSMAADPGRRETAYRVFATTPGIIEKQHEGSVMEAFGRGFKDDAVAVGLPRTSGPRYEL